MMTAGAAPPAAVIRGHGALGFRITHVYGLTEVYGPAVICAWHDEWDALPADERARLKARQGVQYPVLEGLMVADPETLAPVPPDGATMGEVFMRGNIVMKGYLKNPAATDEAFAGGWFHTGDLAVAHPDGYIEIKDRSKDIIISGGENISTIEVEDVLYRHPAVLEAAVVAKPDERWGETPCAFVTLKQEGAATADDIIGFCRGRMAHFKAPRTVVFGPLPKTSTGKIQKFVLRERAKGGLAKFRCRSRVLAGYIASWFFQEIRMNASQKRTIETQLRGRDRAQGASRAAERSGHLAGAALLAFCRAGFRSRKGIQRRARHKPVTRFLLDANIVSETFKPQPATADRGRNGAILWRRGKCGRGGWKPRRGPKPKMGDGRRGGSRLRGEPGG